MTNPSITPPPELVQQWVAEIWHEGTPVQVALSDKHIAAQAAQWGADQELEACCEWLDVTTVDLSTGLRTARRPTPPSLKEQALQALAELAAECYGNTDQSDTIRRALEKLDD